MSSLYWRIDLVVGVGVFLFGWQLMRPYNKYRTVSPLCKVMEAKDRERFKLYAKVRAGSIGVLLLAPALALSLPAYLPAMLGVYSYAAYMLARAFYRRWTLFLRWHSAFDGGVCAPEDLLVALVSFYATHQLTVEAMYGNDYRSLNLTVIGDSAPEGRTHNKALTVKTTVPAWIVASAAQVAFRPVGLYGFRVEMAGSEPVCNLITDPNHGEKEAT